MPWVKWRGKKFPGLLQLLDYQEALMQSCKHQKRFWSVEKGSCGTGLETKVWLRLRCGRCTGVLQFHTARLTGMPSRRRGNL